MILALIHYLTKKQDPKHGKELSVLRACLTRWTSHVLAFRRLLKLREVLMKIIRDDEFEIDLKKRIWFQGRPRDLVKAHKMATLVRNSVFWTNVAW